MHDSAAPMVSRSQEDKIDDARDFEDTISSGADDFNASMRAKFPEPVYKKIRAVGAFIMNGMSLQESCILSRVNFARMQDLMDEHEDVAAFIEFKQIAYKARLTKTMSDDASRGNMRAAGYLLERKYRREYSKDGDGGDEGASNVVEDALEFVRRSGDSDPIVKRLPPPAR